MARNGTKVHREDQTRPRGVQPETWADAEVEIVDGRDKNQGKAATNDAVGSTTANTTVNTAGDAATEKDATLRRLVELHRLSDTQRKPQCHQQDEHRRE